jgi:hypothetical protein
MDGQKTSSPAIATQSPNYGKSSSINQTTTSKISKRPPPAIAPIMSTNSKNRPILSPICTKLLAAQYHTLGAKPSTLDTSPLGPASRATSSAKIYRQGSPLPRPPRSSLHQNLCRSTSYFHARPNFHARQANRMGFHATNPSNRKNLHRPDRPVPYHIQPRQQTCHDLLQLGLQQHHRRAPQITN